MVNGQIKKFPVERILYAFLFIHVIVWAFAPAFMRFTLPLDAMEGTTWGNQLQWGYDKNPFMNAWLTELAVKISGQSGWGIYLFSQLSVVICFWATWQLGKKMLPPLYALAAVFLLESIQYYNLHAIDFSDNTLELSTWALITLFFYQAIHENKLGNWLLTGFFAGLGMMTKYYTALLLLPMALFLIINNDARQSFKNPAIYWGFAIFLIIIMPHVAWLFSHDFVTIDYMFDRVSSKKSAWFTHLVFPLQFTMQQLEVFILPILLLFIFFIGKKSFQEKIQIRSFDKQFLFYVGICPFLLTIALSVIFGMKLHAAWGQPLFSLWGIIFIFWLRPVITLKKFFFFLITLFSLFALASLIYCFNILHAKKPSSANFPGKIIATELTNMWHDKFKTPLKYVAGGRWLAGNISFYSNDHPAIYIDWNNKFSPWINEDTLKREGAIFVWDLSAINRRKEVSQEEIKARFPKSTHAQMVQFNWHRNKNLPPAEILVAFLPPESKHL